MEEYRLGDYRTHCPRFEASVLSKLRCLTKTDRVGLLILGPTGSGKSHLARCFHQESRRKSKPFVTLDCAQVTSELTLAAELFGYAPRSGFANAPVSGSPGAAKRADQGTLFIDEIACLSPPLQQKLLRLVQDGTFSPLGSSEVISVNLQIIAATLEDLEQLVRQGSFRQDLYWRLSDLTLTLPDLDQRKADIPRFAREFLTSGCTRYNLPEGRRFSDEALAALVAHDWSRSGNIRGLERAVHRSLLLSNENGTLLGADDLQLPALLDPSGRGVSSARPSSRPAPELAEIVSAIQHHGSGSAAARALGITRGVLVWHLRKLGMTIHDVRSGSAAERRHVNVQALEDAPG